MSIRHNELGGARLKLVIVLVIIAVVAYVGYLYIPVAVDAYYFKDAMQNKANLAAAQGYDASWLSDQVSKSRAEFRVPDDAVITSAQKDGRMEVRVQFTRPISFPGFTWNYDFDYTAKSTSFLSVR
jgi:hypothetical protein